MEAAHWLVPRMTRQCGSAGREKWQYTGAGTQLCFLVFVVCLCLSS